jgi:hypothetical protein
MSQAIVGLIGVIVGGLITGGFQYALRQRDDHGQSRAAARLLRDAFLIAREHAATRNLSQIMEVYDFQTAVDEWQEQRGALARTLTNKEWSDVADAAALAWSVAGKRSGELGGDEITLGSRGMSSAAFEGGVLDLLGHRLDRAVVSLERIASGRRFQRAVKREAAELALQMAQRER